MSVLGSLIQFVAGTRVQASPVNQNFSDIRNYVNTELVPRDGSVAFTNLPTLPASDPTTDNQPARKKYVDTQYQALGTRIDNLSIATKVSISDSNRLLRANDFVGTTDSNGELTVTFKDAVGTNSPFTTGVTTVVACSGDLSPTGVPAVVVIKSKSTTGFVCRVYRVSSTSGFGIVLDPHANSSVRISYFALGY